MTTNTTTEKKDSGTLVEQMFNVGAHFGRSKSRRHPSMKDFIFGVKNTTEIIDLEKTDDYLARAKDFASSLGTEKKQIFFISSKNESRIAIRDAAMSIGMPYVMNRWIGGTITNFSEIKKRISRLEELTTKKDKGELGMYTKKERLMITREIEKLEKNFGGLVGVRQKPAAVFVIDSKAEKIAVKEAQDSGIPVISLSGSDCDIKHIEYPIPANDSSRSSISFFVNQIVEAYKKGSSEPVSEKPAGTKLETKTKTA